MRIESRVRVAAPPATVFEFFAWLDHLRLVGAARRREWCPELGLRVVEGARQQVILEQGRHHLRLSFVVESLSPGEHIAFVFSSWPLDGARRTLRFSPGEPSEDGTPLTWVDEEDEWRPPFLIRPLVERRLQDQKQVFQKRLELAARIIGDAYAAFGGEVFAAGVLEPARALGFVPDEEVEPRRAGAPG